VGLASTAGARRRRVALAALAVLGVLAAGCTKPPPGHPGPVTGGPTGNYLVTGYVDGRTQAFVTLIPGTRITLGIAAGGRLSGTACNSYGATWSTSPGGRIAIGDIASTDMACLDPAGVMDQESGYLTALGHATRWQRDGSKLTLASGEGRGRVLVTAEQLATHQD
jgi:heat shock protein HslJ